MALEKVETPEGQVRVEGVRNDLFVVAGEVQHGGFLIWPEESRPIEIAGIDALDENIFAPLLSLSPVRDVLLIGTGSRMAWPDFGLLENLRTKVAGVEVMESRAAARTFNLLAGEERLVGALILPL